MESDRVRRTWEGDWRIRLQARVHSLGYEHVSEFLKRFPREPYVEVVKRLGDDIAAIQLECAQFDEAARRANVRDSAIDSLVRDLTWHLKTGWEGGAKGNFNTAGAYVDWLQRLEGPSRNLPSNADLRERGQKVWSALEALRPPLGWLPTGPHDSLVEAAFAAGWPAKSRRQIKRQDYCLLCPNCSAVLSLPSPQSQEIVCHHCGEEIELV
jgi:hypothetical protein